MYLNTYKVSKHGHEDPYTRVSFSFLFFIILSESNFLAKAQTNMTIPVNVGVIRDFDTWTEIGRASCRERV